MQNESRYRLAEICDRKGNLKKRWYVYFYIEDPGTRRLERKIEWISGTLKTKPARYAEALKVKNSINNLLLTGQIGTTRPITREQEYIRIIPALDRALDFKKQYLSDRTIQSYRHFNNLLIEWLKDKRLSDLFIKDFNEYLANRFAEECCTKNKKAKTYNNYVSCGKAIFQRLYDVRLITENPFARIKQLPEDEPEIQIWNKAQRTKLSNYLKKHEPQLYIATLFVFHCFIRPKEILNLKFRNIDLEKGIAMIPFSISKNNRTKPVTLSNQLIELLAPLKKENPEDFYIFSKDLLPGPHLLHRNRITEKFKYARTLAGLPDELKLYSFKHTGNSLMIERGANIKDIMDQNRHYDIAMTGKYVKRITQNAVAVFRNESEDL